MPLPQDHIGLVCFGYFSVVPVDSTTALSFTEIGGELNHWNVGGISLFFHRKHLLITKTDLFLSHTLTSIASEVG